MGPASPCMSPPSPSRHCRRLHAGPCRHSTDLASARRIWTLLAGSRLRSTDPASTPLCAPATQPLHMPAEPRIRAHVACSRAISPTPLGVPKPASLSPACSKPTSLSLVCALHAQREGRDRERGTEGGRKGARDQESEGRCGREGARDREREWPREREAAWPWKGGARVRETRRRSG